MVDSRGGPTLEHGLVFVVLLTFIIALYDPPAGT
jgi:hypothetical protein